jgi:hypothetical protein
MRTWAKGDSGTNEKIVLIINDNGRDDLLHHNLPPRRSPQSDLKRGRSNLYEVPVPASPVNIFHQSLQPSSIRVGIRGGDTWRPEDFFVFGEDNGRPVPLALARTITKTLSTAHAKTPISIPIPPVLVGHSTTDIVGLIVLMLTGAGPKDGTTGSVELRITKAPTTPNAELIVDFDIPTSAKSSPDPNSAQGKQFHLWRKEASFYYVGGGDVVKPFKKTDLDVTKSITLHLQGDDWLPASFFIFGIGREPEVPVTLVPLVHIPDWTLGKLTGGNPTRELTLCQDPPP